MEAPSRRSLSRVRSRVDGGQRTAGSLATGTGRESAETAPHPRTSRCCSIKKRQLTADQKYWKTSWKTHQDRHRLICPRTCKPLRSVFHLVHKAQHPTGIRKPSTTWRPSHLSLYLNNSYLPLLKRSIIWPFKSSATRRSRYLQIPVKNPALSFQAAQ